MAFIILLQINHMFFRMSMSIWKKKTATGSGMPKEIMAEQLRKLVKAGITTKHGFDNVLRILHRITAHI